MKFRVLPATRWLKLVRTLVVGFLAVAVSSGWAAPILDSGCDPVVTAGPHRGEHDGPGVPSATWTRDVPHACTPCTADECASAAACATLGGIAVTRPVEPPGGL